MKNNLQIKLFACCFLLLMAGSLFVKNVVVDGIIYGQSNFSPFLIGSNFSGSNYSAMNRKLNHNYNLIEESVSLSDIENIEEIKFSVPTGNISIQYHNQNNIQIDVDDSPIPTGYYLQNKTLYIAEGIDNAIYNIKAGNITLSLPTNLSLDYEIDSVSSKIHFSVLADDVAINSVSNDILLLGELKSLEFNGVSSSIDFVMGDATEKIEINGVSNNITINDKTSSEKNYNLTYINASNWNSTPQSLKGSQSNLLLHTEDSSMKDVEIGINLVSGKLFISTYE